MRKVIWRVSEVSNIRNPPPPTLLLRLVETRFVNFPTRLGPFPAFFSPSLSLPFTLFILLNAVSVDIEWGRLNGEREGGVKEARSVGEM